MDCQVSAARFTSRERSGFTLVEVIVVIGIISLLVALLLPAVQTARGASYRAVCAGNMRQLGIALQSYVSQHNHFPAGRTYTSHSALAAILPHLEQDELFDQINFDVYAEEHLNYTVRRTQIAIYLCPADIRPSSEFVGTNYAACSGRGKSWFGDDGIFDINPPWRRPEEVTDGTTHTAAFAEWVHGTPNAGNQHGSMFATPEPRIPREPVYLDQFLAACRNVDTLGSAGVKGQFWNLGGFGNTLYNHLLTPNENSCSNAGNYPSAAITAGSRHPGGAHVLFADSSVRFISSSIDIEPWRAFSTRSYGDR